MDRGGASARQQPSAANRGGGDRIGNRSVSSGSSSRGGGGAFGGGGGGYSGSSARASSSRGASSMGSRGGGGGGFSGGGPAAGEVAAGGGGRQAMIGYTHMRSNRFCAFPSAVLLAAQVTVLSCALSTLVHAVPQTKPTSAADSAQMSFATPQLAAEALIKAAARFRRSCSIEHPRTGWPGFDFFGGPCPG